MDTFRTAMLIGFLQVLLIGITVGQPPGFGRPWQSRGGSRSFRPSRPSAGFQGIPPQGPEYRTLGAQGLNSNFPGGPSFSGRNMDVQRPPTIRTLNRGSSRTRTWQTGTQRQPGTIVNTQRGPAGPQRRPIVIRHSQNSQRSMTSSRSQVPVVRSQSGSRSRAQLTQQQVRSSQTVRRHQTVASGKPRVVVTETKQLPKQPAPIVSVSKQSPAPITQPGKITQTAQAGVPGQTVIQTSHPDKAIGQADVVQHSMKSNPASVITKVPNVVPKQASPLQKFGMPSKDLLHKPLPQHGPVLPGPKLVTVQTADQKTRNTQILPLTPHVQHRDQVIAAPKQASKVAPVIPNLLHKQPISPRLADTSVRAIAQVPAAPITSAKVHTAPLSPNPVHTSHITSTQLHTAPVASSSAHAGTVGSGVLHTAPLVSNVGSNPVHAASSQLHTAQVAPVASHAIHSNMHNSAHHAAYAPTVVHNPAAATLTGHAHSAATTFTGNAHSAATTLTGNAHSAATTLTSHAHSAGHLQNGHGQLMSGHAYPAVATHTQSVQDELVAAFVAALQEQLAQTPAAQPAAVQAPAPAQPPAYHQAHAQMYNPYAAYYQPMMAAHLYPAYMQEMFFGDTQDPPDPTAAVPNTTTSAPEPSTVAPPPEPTTLAIPDPTTLAPPDPTTLADVSSTVIVTDAATTVAATTAAPVTTRAQTSATAAHVARSSTAAPSPHSGERTKMKKFLVVEPLNKETIAKLAAVSNAVKELKGNMQPETRARLVQGIRKIVSNSKVDFASLQAALTKQLTDLKTKTNPPANEVTAAHHVTDPPSPLAQTTLPTPKLKSISAADPMATVQIDQSPPTKVVSETTQVQVQSLVDGGQTSNTATLEAMLKEIVIQSNGSKTLPHELKNVNFTEIARSLTPKGTDLATQLSDPNFVKVLREIAAKIHLMARKPKVTSVGMTKTKTTHAV